MSNLDDLSESTKMFKQAYSMTGKFKFQQHVPGFVDAEPLCFEAESEEEFFKNEYFDHIKKDPTFFKLSYSDSVYRKMLMAEYNEGMNWWVLGYIEFVPNLPVWEEPEASRIIREEKNRKRREEELKNPRPSGAFEQAAIHLFGENLRKSCVDFLNMNKNITDDIKRDVDKLIET